MDEDFNRFPCAMQELDNKSIIIMMNNRTERTLSLKRTLLAILILMLVSACSFLAPRTVPKQLIPVYTQAALTFVAEHPEHLEYLQTIAAYQANYSTITPLPSATPLPTTTPLPTYTQLPKQFDTSYSCYYGSRMTFETIPDGTVLHAGQSFNKTWEFYNSGSCGWNSYFRLVFRYGTRMGGSNTYLGDYISPGEYVEVTVSMTAPTTPGRYLGYWQLMDDHGYLFGTNSYVDIIVLQPSATPTRTLTPVPPTATQTQTPTETATSTNTPTLTETPP